MDTLLFLLHSLITMFANIFGSGEGNYPSYPPVATLLGVVSWSGFELTKVWNQVR